MSDSEFTMFVFLWIFGAGIVIQSIRLFLLRRKFDRLALRNSQPAPDLPLAPSPPAARDDDELVRIKQRLHVLERIATDKSARLDEELDALRRA